jgi:hypothetical protein
MFYGKGVYQRREATEIESTLRRSARQTALESGDHVAGREQARKLLTARPDAPADLDRNLGPAATGA